MVATFGKPSPDLDYVVDRLLTEPANLGRVFGKSRYCGRRHDTTPPAAAAPRPAGGRLCGNSRRGRRMWRTGAAPLGLFEASQWKSLRSRAGGPRSLKASAASLARAKLTMSERRPSGQAMRHVPDQS